MPTPSNFIPGLKLSEMYYDEAVRPVLERHFPALAYSAGLFGSGSDVLGFDTARSMDHDWGPRLSLFLGEQDYDDHGDAIGRVLGDDLPYTFHGIPTSFAVDAESGDKMLDDRRSGPVQHRVELYTVASFVGRTLGVSFSAALAPADWLALPEQRLLSVSRGTVFFDGLDQLEAMRAKYAYYPHDVWLYLLACQWRRIAQEEPFVGRTASVGDGTGSRIIAARLVRDLMKLGFLMEKQYAPYMKWFGSAFSRLEIAGRLGPVLDDALQAPDFNQREAALSRAYHIVAEKHNALGITRPLPTDVSPFHDRPYLVIHGDIFSREIKAAITDEAVKAIAPTDFGAIDQFVDSTDVLAYPDRYRRLRMMYE